ncbi:MAG: hypothetical protein AAF546_10620 [Verrucomicrobiota bacterium]
MKTLIVHLLILGLTYTTCLAAETPLTLVDLKLEQAGISAAYRNNHPLAQEIAAKIETYKEVYPERTLQSDLSLAMRRFTELKVEQASLSSKYREKHPERVKMERKIEFFEGSFEIQYDESLLRSLLSEKEAAREQVAIELRSSNPEIIAIDRSIQFIEKTIEELEKRPASH